MSRCNSDGSWDAVWAVSTYTSTGSVGMQSYYCEACLGAAVTLGLWQATQKY